MPLRQSLSDIATKYHFRAPLPGESDETYRQLLAQRIEGFDRIEAQEVRINRPWDQWSSSDRNRWILNGT